MRHMCEKYGDMGHNLFLNSTCDNGEKISDRDMRLCRFLKSPCNIGDPPFRAPYLSLLNSDLKWGRSGRGWGLGLVEVS